MSKLAGLLGLAVALLASGPALADGYGRRVPSPIPVPAPVPIPDTFTYYLRADIQWGFSGTPSYSERGRTYGTGVPFDATVATFGFGGSEFTSNGTSVDDTFSGTIGFGAYLGTSLRGDITLDFRGEQAMDNTSTYAYTASGGPATGTATDTVRLRGTVGMANLYWDILPRGHFSPYIGAGAGFVYNDISRAYLATETVGGTPRTISGAGNEANVGFAGALMAGITFASDHRFVWDLSYRALYLEGGSVTTTLTSTGLSQTSTVDIGNQWEHQVRIGVRANLW